MAIGIRLVIALYARRGAERTGLGRDRPRIRLYGIPSPAPRGARDIDYDIDYIREYRVIASIRFDSNYYISNEITVL